MNADKNQGVSTDVESFADRLPDRLEDVRMAAESWKQRAVEFLKERPGVAVVGAFALGFALAKVARHA